LVEPDFDQLYARAYPRLVAQVTALTRDQPTAEDCVQEAFARAWVRWERISQYDDVESWVRRVAYNLAKSHWRRLRHLVKRSPVPEVQDNEATIEFLSMLEGLRPQQRQALVLHYLLDMSVDSVASEMRVPPGTVKSLLSRGRRDLARSLVERETISDGHIVRTEAERDKR
jgi:RNA polymerase sigma-70 factor, ECF subfamily